MILAGSAFAQSPEVSLRVETASGGMQFRIGETIDIKLTFESTSAEKWMLNTTGRDRSLFHREQFLVSPKQGTSDPQGYRALEGFGGSQIGGVVMLGKPWSMNVDLNQWVRFERAGRYRVSALVHVNGKQGQDLAVISNESEIEIVPAEKAWLAEQLGRAVAVLDAPAGTDPPSFNLRASAVRTIWYLDTPESVREAARLVGRLDEQTAGPLLMALRGSNHQADAIAAMNELLRLPDQAVTAAFIQTLARMESGNPGAANPYGGRSNEAYTTTEQQVRSDLASVVARKRGEAKAISLNTVVSGMGFEAITENQRAELAAVFMDLPWRQQNDLLIGQWKRIAGPAMIPVLRQIYESPQKPTFQSLAPAAVQRLYELDPAPTRTLILDDMKLEHPRLPFETLAILPDATLPEMDDVLLDHLEHGTGLIELIPRYATAKVLDGVKEWYAKQDATMRTRRRPDQPGIPLSLCQPALIGYYLRVDPAWGERVLRAVLNDRRSSYGGCWMGILGRTAKYEAGPAWERVAIETLADPVVAVKSDAVKALGEHGSAAAQRAVMDAFRGWHDWWKDRPAEMVSEGQFEQAFLQASMHAQNWIANGQELEKVRGFCITSGCRDQAGQYIRVWGDAVPVSIGESGGGELNVSFAQYYARSLDAARGRLLQLPSGTRLKWNINIRHTPEIDAWVAAIDSDLAGRGVVITP
jgi:hypothetical protein